MDFAEIITDAVAYHNKFINAELARRMLTTLLTGIEWSQEHITFNGARVPLPRLVAWYGDPGATYSYSGINHVPLAWSAPLLELKDAVEVVAGMGYFNSVLLNRYRDGNDSVGFHADNERDLIDSSAIATLSLGSRRKFQLRSRYEKPARIIDVDLAPGSLLLMYGSCQRDWLHSVPKEQDALGERISLTFRRVKISRSPGRGDEAPVF